MCVCGGGGGGGGRVGVGDGVPTIILLFSAIFTLCVGQRSNDHHQVTINRA